ncbi:hypothetical protein ACE7GA_02865 [Roseomonas sp. CCTCC AB2023176]|uniref:hypothetical protein n=1 Tax=Roseomonas sp. CCTCC AB2023176 TaxID=3342640 RepID=UPI0035D54276
MRPYGPLPLVWELPDDASRARYLRWNAYAPLVVLPGTLVGFALGALALRGSSAWLIGGVLVLVGSFWWANRLQMGRGRRVSASLWRGPTPMERRVAADPRGAARGAFVILIAALLLLGMGCLGLARFGFRDGRVPVLLVAGALLTLAATFVYSTVRRVRKQMPGVSSGT